MENECARCYPSLANSGGTAPGCLTCSDNPLRIEYVALNGKRYSRVDYPGKFLGTIGQVTKADLQTYEGPNLSAGPGDFVIVSPEGKRSVVANSDRRTYWIEGDKVWERVFGPSKSI